MKKVKKFGRGGDILTGLGAGLAGYGIYKALNKDKDDDYTRRVKEFGTKGRFPEEKTEEKATPKREEYVPADKEELDAKRRAMAASAGRPEMGGGDKAIMNSDKTAEITPRNTTTPVVKKAKKAKKKKDEPPKTTAPKLKPGESRVVGEGKLKPYPKVTRNLVPNEDRPSKPYPTEQAEANKVKNIPGVTVMKPSDKEIKDIKAKQAAAARAKKGQGLIPYASSGREEIMRNNRFHKEAELGRGIKKGGMVKKYSSGGSVSSASKRADGIAIRGKTRA
jgi:hypothetical protein